MQCHPVESYTHALSLAPCPPPMFREFTEFQAIGRRQNLTDCEINFVARKCNIKNPNVILTSSAVAKIPKPPYVTSNVTEVTARASAFTATLVTLITILVCSLVALCVIVAFVCLWRRRKMGKQEKKMPVDSPTQEEYPLSPPEKLPLSTPLPNEALLPSNGQKRSPSLLYPDGQELDDLKFIDDEADTIESPSVVKRRINPHDLYVQTRTGSMVCNPDVIDIS